MEGYWVVLYHRAQPFHKTAHGYPFIAKHVGDPVFCRFSPVDAPLFITAASRALSMLGWGFRAHREDNNNNNLASGTEHLIRRRAFMFSTSGQGPLESLAQRRRLMSSVH